jgi:hypothetical protein
MQTQTEFTCAHAAPQNCPDALIIYSDKLREYGLLIHDGGSSSLAINFCPWCGAKLPDSLRERWFEELAALGFDDPWSQEIPAAFRSGAWYGAA